MILFNTIKDEFVERRFLFLEKWESSLKLKIAALNAARKKY